MVFGGDRVPFGKKVVERAPEPVRSDPGDGKRRIVSHAEYAAGEEFYRRIGFDIDGADNIIPDKAEFDRRFQGPFERQAKRRSTLKAALLAEHGCDNIRPFFTFGDGVWMADFGDSLIRDLELLPHDDWNVTYLPMDARTAAAMKLPLHPQMTIKPFDEAVMRVLTLLRARLDEELQRARPLIAQIDVDAALQFDRMRQRTKADVLGAAARMGPKFIQAIAEAPKARHANGR